MKICAIICEFNPFHNGHEYLLEQARRLSGCDKVLCIMSGSFTQRGDAAILDKYTRAKHAMLGGADAVIQLPAAFSVAPAEIFAEGAAKIITAIPEVDSVAFGCECGNLTMIGHAANILNDESELFKKVLEENLSSGEGYPKSLSRAFAACGGDGELLQKPNNILAVEYVKAFKKSRFKGKFIAVKRSGAGHGTTEAVGDIASSSAIRKNISENNARFVPHFVADDLSRARDITIKLHEAERLCVLRDGIEELSRVYGINEGLENALKQHALLPYDDLIKNTAGKRYPSSRIERALCANLLKLYKNDCEEYLNSQLYIKPLAVKGGEILSALGASEFPLVVRGREAEKLSPAAKKCLQSDIFADDVYNILGGEKIEFFTMLKL